MYSIYLIVLFYFFQIIDELEISNIISIEALYQGFRIIILMAGLNYKIKK